MNLIFDLWIYSKDKVNEKKYKDDKKKGWK
jgi:hypothetical protein